MFGYKKLISGQFTLSYPIYQGKNFPKIYFSWYKYEVIGNNINFRMFIMLFPNKQITILCPIIEVICYNNNSSKIDSER